MYPNEFLGENGRNYLAEKPRRKAKKRLPSFCSPPPQKNQKRDMTALSGTSLWRLQSRYTASRIECRIKFTQNQRYRAKIALHPPNQGVAPFSGPPPVALSCLTRSRQGARGGGGPGGWWRVSRHFWVAKTDRNTGGCRSYSHTSRATLCN